MPHYEIAAEKAALRETMKSAREGLHDATGEAAEQVAGRYAGDVAALTGAIRGAPRTAVVSIYAAIGAELDPLPLLRKLESYGLQGALPVIGRKGQPLTFRAYSVGDALDERMWGIREPKVDRPLLTPDILIMPLLAFDGDGWRLGYGGGFYDRTLARLRAEKGASNVFAIGLAYDGQRVDVVPHADYDERMDGILTPSGLLTFKH